MPPHYTKKYTEALPDTCGACGRIGHRNNGCTLPPAPWDRLGVEVEGFWEGQQKWIDAKTLAIQITGGRGVSDGSLNCDSAHECDSMAEHGECDCDNTQDEWYAWEFRGRPGNMTEAASQLMRLYPDGVNNSAGAHVHASFKESVDIALLKSQAFYDYWAKRWQSWGTRMKIREGSAFWNRLTGGNSYCRVPKLGYEGERYSQLNFDCAWGAHQTLECRLLPMFQNAKLTYLGLREVCDIYDSWLTGGLWQAHVPKAHVVVPDLAPVAHADLTVECDLALPMGVLDEERVLPTYHDVPDAGCAMVPHSIAETYDATWVMANRMALPRQTVNPTPDPQLAELRAALAPPPPPIPALLPDDALDLRVAASAYYRVSTTAYTGTMLLVEDTPF